MSIGPATIIALMAAVLATIGWYVTSRLTARAWLAMLVYGALLVLVLNIGPLVKLP